MGEDFSIWIELAIALLFLLVVSLSLKIILSFIRRYFAKRKKEVSLEKVVRLPLQVGIWGVGVALIAEAVFSYFELEFLLPHLHLLRNAFIIACLGWMALRWNKALFKSLGKKSQKLGVSPTAVYALGKLASFLILLTTLLFLFQIFGFKIGPLLAFGGIGMAAFGFAAQEIIANFFGGIMLHFTGSFAIGHHVMIPSQKNYEGKVREIGWYMTVLEGENEELAYFPNALFTKACVINQTQKKK